MFVFSTTPLGAFQSRSDMKTESCQCQASTCLSPPCETTMIFKGPESRDVFNDPPEASVLKLIVKYLRKHGDKLAFVACDKAETEDNSHKKSATYSQVLKWVCSISAQLNRRGLTKGDFVLFLCTDKTISAYCLLLGTMLAGATALPISLVDMDQFFSDNLKKAMALRVKWIFYDHHEAEYIDTYVNENFFRPTCMVTKVAMLVLANTDSTFIFKVDDVKKHVPLILHSGGTKPVMISDSALTGYGQKTLYERRMADIGPFLVVYSFYWSTGFAVLLASIFHGFPLYLCNNEDYITHLTLIDIHKIKSCLLMSTHVSRYPKYRTLPRIELFKSLRHVWITGAQTGSSTKELFKKSILRNRTGVQDVYSTVELGIVTTWEGKRPTEISKQNSVGFLKSGVECKVKDDKGRLLTSPDVGHLWFKSCAQFSCYWELPDVTEDSLDADGFFKTGDIGYFDSEGLLYVLGAAEKLSLKRNLERRGVLEDYLRSHKGVVSAVVVLGKPNGSITGFVVLRNDFLLPKGDIMELFADNPSLGNSFKRRIHKVKCIPTITNGKPCIEALCEETKDLGVI